MKINKHTNVKVSLKIKKRIRNEMSFCIGMYAHELLGIS